MNFKKEIFPQGKSWILFILLTAIIGISGAYIYKSISRYSEFSEIGSRAFAASSGTFQTQPEFDLSKSAIPTEEIFSGGPKKDGIPSITDPKMIPARLAKYMQDHDRVVGVSFDGEHRAYPLKILTSHEAVNDSIKDVHYSVTYCPLCDSVVVFNRKQSNGRVIEFGISGLLYNSNVLLYDRQRRDRPESLWSQVQAQSVAGEATGQTLESLPYQLTTWLDWKNNYPETQVMSDKTGHSRNYDSTPYEHYFNSPDLAFPVSHVDDRLPLKERVLGININHNFRAYPVSVIKQAGGEIQDSLAGQAFTIRLSGEDAYLVHPPENATIMNAFWFSWAAFYPETDIYTTE